MHDRPTVLVTGATGAVGPALVQRLLRDGCRVRVLSRGIRPVPWPDGAVEVYRGDVGHRAAVARAVEGADWVFHMAALLHLPHPGPELLPAYERVNVEGTRVVAEESAHAGAERLVFFSSISVYGATGPEGADEETPSRPNSTYSETKVRAEEVVRMVHGQGRLTTSILRVAAVYGPRVKGNYAILVRAIEAGWFLPVGPGLNRRTLVHELDAAEAALLVARSAPAAGRVYNVSDGQIHRLHDVIEALYQALGRSSPPIRLPIGLARAAARVGDTGLSIFGREERLVSLLDKYTEDVAVRADRIQSELGFRARFDLRSGWQDALRARI